MNKRIERAYEEAKKQTDDDLEMDDREVTQFSESEKGIWVSAWIYVPDEEE